MIFLYTLCLIIQGSLALISSTPDFNSVEVPLNTSDIGESAKLVGFQTLPTVTIYTYHVSIYVMDTTGAAIEYCSGTLVSTIFVLTSATCVSRGTSLVVHYGGNDGAGVSTATVSQVINHPKFERNTMKYDVALLRLPAAVTVSTTVSIVSLPTTSIGLKDNKDFEGQTLRVVGWRLLTDAQAWADTQYRRGFADMRVLSTSECSTAMKASDFNIYYPTMSCFSNTNTAGTSAVGACRGDWGAPTLYFQSGNSGAVMVGLITSFRRCGETTVWTRIGPMLSWIRQHL